MTAKEIQKAIKNQNNKIIELVRYDIDEISMLLSPVYQGAELFCAKLISDFQADGFKFIRSKFITEIITAEKNETLSFYNHICQKEGLLKMDQCSYNCDTFRKLFEELSKSGEAVTVECNFEDAIDYYFGKVTDLTGNLATMQCFDGAGVIFKDKVRVNLDFVSMVTIGDRYTSTMAKYVKW